MINRYAKSGVFLTEVKDMKSKKLMIIALCAVMAMTAVGCGSKNKSAAPEASTQQSETKNGDEKKADGQNNGDDEKNSAGSSKNQGEKSGNSGDSKKSDEAKESNGSGSEQTEINTMDDLQGKVDEFNNTTDPERKEELRQELEKFIKQAEEQSANNA